MRNIYDALLDGIEAEKSNEYPTDLYLTSLQPSVKSLRLAYRKTPVHVPYHEEKIQSAYLLTYFPHYYQLIQKIFQEGNFEFLIESRSINVVFVGGGPGSEAFGLIKYLNERCEKLEELTVTILDINASSWDFSHEVVKKELVADLGVRVTIELNWQALNYDLTSIDDTNTSKSLFRSANLVVLQNCINEVSNASYPELFRNVDRIFELLNGNTIFLMIDHTSSVRAVLQEIQNHLVNKFKPKDVVTTLCNRISSSMLSLNATPNERVRKNLLNGSDGLIPRKHLKYDYSLLVKNKILEKKSKEEFGFTGLYQPLNEKNLKNLEDVKNKVFIGFDFGTSVSVVSYSYVEDGKVVLKTLEIDQRDWNGNNSTSPLIPTSMAFYNNKVFMLGKHALELGANLDFGKNYWDGFKSNLGNLSALQFPHSDLIDHPQIGISNGKDGLTTFLKRLRIGIENKLAIQFPESDFYYTWSVPANYGIKQKCELRECGASAGFYMEGIPFVEEPVSALINYVYESGDSLNTTEVILVLDIGAGTVDVSILEIEKDFDNINSKLLAVERISEIGGNKINYLMAVQFRNELSSAVEQKKLEQFCERLKMSLCKGFNINGAVRFQLPPLATSQEKREINTDFGENLSLSFSDFSNIMKEYWGGKGGVSATLVSALDKANIQGDQVSKVILTGGGSRNPYIQSFTYEKFINADIIISDNIQEQVARGNALQSLTQHLFGKNIINPVLHHDVCLYVENYKVLLFEKGTICPTVDAEKVLHSGSFEIIYGQEKLIFCVSQMKESYKALFFVDSDLELHCEVLVNDTIKSITPQIISYEVDGSRR